MKISYKVNNSSRNIYFEKNILKLILKDIEKLESDKKILLIFDKNIDHKFIQNIKNALKIVGSKVIIVEAEGNKIKKNEKLLFKIIDIFIRNNFTKRSILICAGGGVVGDVAGLAASLYLRGMLYFNIPTTMTSIIDSCLGGKTAINYKNIINSVGNYYHPNAIYISTEVIKDIPDREYFAGFSEILKCALISKKKNFMNFLINNQKKILNRDEKFLKKICYETLNTKIFFFVNDVYEQKERLMLNFGHTFAHAIEMSTDLLKKDFYRHGEAVGIGILCELYYANKGKNKIFKTVEKFLNELNLPTKINNEKFNKKTLHSDIYKFLFLDKKKLNKFPRYISLKSQGKPRIDELDNDTLINETIIKMSQ